MEHGILLFVKKNHNPKTKIDYLAAFYSKVFLKHIVSQCSMKKKIFKKDIREVSVNLSRA
jgi:hypothetical protein